MGHVFISYSHKDKEYVHKLQVALSNEGLEVWIDDRIDYGTEWPKIIQDHLDECEVFIVVMSENAYASAWVQDEVMRAKRKKKPTFPLLLQGDCWLPFESTQYFDVTDGGLPNSKFYESLLKKVNAAKPILPSVLKSKSEEFKADLSKNETKEGFVSPDTSERDEIIKGRIVARATRSFIEKGDDFSKRYKWKYAIDEYTQAIGNDPNKSSIYAKRARAYASLDKLHEALIDYNKAIELSSMETENYLDRAHFLAYYLKDFASALADYNKIIEISPMRADSYYARGSFYSGYLYDYENAVKDFTKAIEIDQKNGSYYRSRANTYDEMGEHDKANLDKEMEKELDRNWKRSREYLSNH